MPRKTFPGWREATAGTPRWVTQIDWSNNGGRTWNSNAVYLPGGSVKETSTQQCRWSCSILLAGVSIGPDGIQPYSTRIRIKHGIDGIGLIDLGRYRVTEVTYADDNPDGGVHIEASSYEDYVQRAGFRHPGRKFYPEPARDRLERLIREVLPSAQFTWLVDGNLEVPKLTEPSDRWGMIDGGPDAPSIAKALGARVFVGPTGSWVIAPAATLQDVPSRVVRSADPLLAPDDPSNDGVMLSYSEGLSNDGVYNVVTVAGESSDTAPFRPGIAADLDPESPTYVGRSVDDGGYGEAVAPIYTNPNIRTHAQAQTAAEARLAANLGLRQQIQFTQLADPSIAAGDVVVIDGPHGPRRAILDDLDHSLDGHPLTGTTRTTATRLAGDQYELPEEAAA